MRRPLWLVVWVASVLAASSAWAWRSSLYPEDWTPGRTDAAGRFLHDFSYAGYHRGEEKIPERPAGAIYDVTQPPYCADASGHADATHAIQCALDDAGAAGGGIVFLPEGTFMVAPRGENRWALRVAQNGVVVRGAGCEKTRICNAEPVMRNKAVILFQPRVGNWHEPLPGTVIAVAEDVGYPTHTITLRSTEGLAPGDVLMLYADCTEAFAAAFDMEDVWPHEIRGITFCREILAVDAGSNTIRIDIPTRYPLKVRDGARIYKVAPHLEECGLEDLSIGMQENRNPVRGHNEYHTPGNRSYEVHGSHAVMFRHARDCWMQRVSSYKPQSNGKIQLLSNGVQLSKSSRITVRDCRMEWAGFRGGGGNGYGFTLCGNDCLVKDCIASECRHNYDLKSMTSSGNVILRCLGGKTKLPSDFHMHMSVANLFDCMTMENGDWLSAVYRDAGGRAVHGHCTTESVFWNSRGNGGGTKGKHPEWNWDGESLVWSSQWGWGYVIGTRGVQFKVKRTEDRGSAPLDFLEGEGRGETLEPPSLYVDQLNRRLNRND